MTHERKQSTTFETIRARPNPHKKQSDTIACNQQLEKDNRKAIENDQTQMNPIETQPETMKHNPK